MGYLPILEKLAALVEKHERAAAGLRLAMSELNGHVKAKKEARGIEGTIAQAAALRHAAKSERLISRWTPARRAAQAERMRARYRVPRAQPQAPKKPSYAGQNNTSRRKTAKLLARIAATDTPVPARVLGKRLAVLYQHGYIKKAGDGWVTTDKPFKA